MPTRRRGSSRGVDQWAASQFVEKLNAASAQYERLRVWVSAWLQAGRELRQVPEEVQKEINQELEQCFPCLATIQRPASQRSVYMTWPPRADIVFLCHVQEHLRAAELAEFIQSPDSSRLAYCARLGCDRYFLREGKRTTYCSPKCAHGDSARRATKQGRERRTTQLLTRARKFLEHFGRTWPNDWKEQLCNDLNAYAASRRGWKGVTKNWVTRRQNKGDLPPVPPTKSMKPQRGRRSG